MTQNGIHATHADDVIAAFKTTIGPDIVQQIGAENLADLALLVESAIDAAIIQRLETIADDLTTMATAIRYDAENRGS